MASRGKSARTKGHNFERLIAREMTGLLNITFRRGLDQTRADGSKKPDVYCEDMDIMHIETKRQVKCSIKNAMAQAEADISASPVYRMPIVITQDDKVGPRGRLVTMKWDDWKLWAQVYVEQYQNKHGS